MKNWNNNSTVDLRRISKAVPKNEKKEFFCENLSGIILNEVPPSLSKLVKSKN